MLKKDLYLVVIGLVSSAYIAIFYDIFKHIIKNYVEHVTPIVDNTVGYDAFAGFLSIGIGILVVLALKKDKKKNGNKNDENPES